MFFERFFKKKPQEPQHEPVVEYVATIREPYEIYFLGRYSGEGAASHILKIVDGKRTHIFESADSSMKKEKSQAYILFVKPWLEGSPTALDELKKYIEKKKEH